MGAGAPGGASLSGRARRETWLVAGPPRTPRSSRGGASRAPRGGAAIASKRAAFARFASIVPSFSKRSSTAQAARAGGRIACRSASQEGARDGVVVERAVHLISREHAGQRQVTARDALRQAHQVRRHARLLAGEHRPPSVGDEQHLVPVGRARGAAKAGGTCACRWRLHHGLDDERQRDARRAPRGAARGRRPPPPRSVRAVEHLSAWRAGKGVTMLWRRSPPYASRKSATSVTASAPRRGSRPRHGTKRFLPGRRGWPSSGRPSSARSPWPRRRRRRRTHPSRPGASFASRSESSTTGSCVNPASMACSRRPSWPVMAALMAGCTVPNRFTHQELASTKRRPSKSSSQAPSPRATGTRGKRCVVLHLRAGVPDGSETALDDVGVSSAVSPARPCAARALVASVASEWISRGIEPGPWAEWHGPWNRVRNTHARERVGGSPRRNRRPAVSSAIDVRREQDARAARLPASTSWL